MDVGETKAQIPLKNKGEHGLKRLSVRSAFYLFLLAGELNLLQPCTAFLDPVILPNFSILPTRFAIEPFSAVSLPNA